MRLTLTLSGAKERFVEYRHIIGLSKSHQKTKNVAGSEKAACDRFRVLLFLDHRVQHGATGPLTGSGVCFTQWLVRTGCV